LKPEIRSSQDDAEPSLRQRACLVEDDCVEGARPVERRSVADEQAVPAASAVGTATTSGTAMPRARGQVMTITVTVRPARTETRPRRPATMPRSRRRPRVRSPSARPRRGWPGPASGSGTPGLAGPSRSPARLVPGLLHLDGNGGLTVVEHTPDHGRAFALLHGLGLPLHDGGLTRTRSPRFSWPTGTSRIEPPAPTRCASAGMRRTRLSAPPAVRSSRSPRQSGAPGPPGSQELQAPAWPTSKRPLF
jgi:hypothetical protein